MTEYILESEIERRASTLLSDFFASQLRRPSTPVPIEEIADYLDIPLRWEPIPPRNQEISVSKIIQPTFGRTSMVIMNEDLQDSLFLDHPWLERTALAHEIGHHQLHVRHSLRFQLPLDLAIDETPVVPTRLGWLINEDSGDLINKASRFMGVSNDEWRQEFQAHAFMRYLLMPLELMLPLIEDGAFLNWSGVRGIYDLSNEMKVTPSALVVHLTRLGYLRVANKTIFPGHLCGSSRRLPF